MKFEMRLDFSDKRTSVLVRSPEIQREPAIHFPICLNEWTEIVWCTCRAVFAPRAMLVLLGAATPASKSPEY